MDMNNQFESNEDYVVDIELLHFEKLIEEREAYEEDFFSLEPPVDEFDYMISQYDLELEAQEINYALDDFEEDLVYPFEDEDFLIQLRDEKLIEERESYEKDYFEFADFPDNDIFDFQISSREGEEFIEVDEFDYDFEYEPEYEDYEYYQYEEDMYWNLFYLKKSQFAAPECGCADLDYMPHDDGLCDYMDCYDYPEGPDENLCGMKYY